jgi:hypothetical protein
LFLGLSFFASGWRLLWVFGYGWFVLGIASICGFIGVSICVGAFETMLSARRPERPDENATVSPQPIPACARGRQSIAAPST